MLNQSVVLSVSNASVESSTVIVLWTVTGRSSFLNNLPFEVRYLDRTLSPLDMGPPPNLLRPALFAFLSVTLPLLCLEHQTVIVEVPYALTDYDSTYFEQLLQRLGLKSKVLWQLGNQALPAIQYANPESGRVGLLYGGGVESNSALFRLIDRRPMLLSVIGERWMNNPITGRTVKYQLEQNLCDDFGLDIVYVAQNGREIMRTSDVLMNHFCTGPFFYWLITPHATRASLRTCFISQELEYTLIRKSMDYSLTPMFLFEVAHRDGPMLIPIMGWYSSVELLDQLRGTPFIRYIYSCFRNTDRRWCGDCTKCYRVSEFCKRLGIPLELIGMQEGIPSGSPEGTRLYELHWRTANLLYPRTDEELYQQTDVMLADICQQERFELRNVGFGHFMQEKGNINLHPNDPGAESAELHLYDVPFDGQNTFRATAEVRNAASAAVVFSVEVIRNGGDSTASSEVVVRGGESELLVFTMQPLFDAAHVILSTRMAEGARSAYSAWAFFNRPVFFRPPEAR